MPTGKPSPRPCAGRLLGPHTSRNWPGHWKPIPRCWPGTGILRRCARSRGWSTYCTPPGSAGSSVRPAPLPPGRANRQATRRDAGLSHVHRPLPHRGMRALRSPPRTGHARRAGQPAVRELLHHRPGEPGDLHQLRPPTPGRPPDPARTAVPQLPRIAAADLFHLRRHHTLRHLSGHRPAVVSGLPAPPGGSDPRGPSGPRTGGRSA